MPYKDFLEQPNSENDIGKSHKKHGPFHSYKFY